MRLILITCASEEGECNLQTPMYAPDGAQDQWRRWNPYSPTKSFISSRSHTQSFPSQPDGTQITNSSGSSSMSFGSPVISSPDRLSPESPKPKAQGISGHTLIPHFFSSSVPTNTPRSLSEYAELLPISMSIWYIKLHQQNPHFSDHQQLFENTEGKEKTSNNAKHGLLKLRQSLTQAM